MSLSPEESEYYSSYYQPVLGSGILGWVQRSIHRFMDSSLDKRNYTNVLEVGSGYLEHISASKVISFDRYIATDIRYDDEVLVAKLLDKLDLSDTDQRRFVLEYGNAEKLSYKDETFELLIATCLLIHLKEPEKALLEWRRVIKDGGELIIYVPCEPGFLLRLGRKLAVIPKHKKLGFDGYSLVCAREHISSLNILSILIKHVFKEDDVSIKTWPIPRFPLWNLNLAYFYHIRIQERDSEK